MTTAKYKQAREVCVRHAARLSWAMDDLAQYVPFDARRLANLTPLELAICDQFIVRFSKLQDAMGTGLLPALLDLAGEPGEMPTFVDKLNRLEKIGAIRSAQDWQEMRQIRNQLAHDYPDDPALQASLLNRALELCQGAARAAGFHGNIRPPILLTQRTA